MSRPKLPEGNHRQAISLSLPGWLVKRLKLKAKQKGTTVSSLVEADLREKESEAETNERN